MCTKIISNVRRISVTSTDCCLMHVHHSMLQAAQIFYSLNQQAFARRMMTSLLVCWVTHTHPRRADKEGGRIHFTTLLLILQTEPG